MITQAENTATMLEYCSKDFKGNRNNDMGRLYMKGSFGRGAIDYSILKAGKALGATKERFFRWRQSRVYLEDVAIQHIGSFISFLNDS